MSEMQSRPGFAEADAGNRICWSNALAKKGGKLNLYVLSAIIFIPQNDYILNVNYIIALNRLFPKVYGLLNLVINPDFSILSIYFEQTPVISHLGHFLLYRATVVMFGDVLGNY